jgi:hypothetical protein
MCDKSKLSHLEGALGVPMGILGEQWCGVYEGKLPNSDVPIYFLDYEEYFGRDAIYNDDGGKGFLDNDNRFIFLSSALNWNDCRVVNTLSSSLKGISSRSSLPAAIFSISNTSFTMVSRLLADSDISLVNFSC